MFDIVIQKYFNAYDRHNICSYLLVRWTKWNLRTDSISCRDKQVTKPMHGVLPEKVEVGLKFKFCLPKWNERPLKPWLKEILRQL